MWSTNSASNLLNCFSFSDDDDDEPEQSNISQYMAPAQLEPRTSEIDRAPETLDGDRSKHGCSTILFQESAFANMDVDDMFDEDDDDIV